MWCDKDSPGNIVGSKRLRYNNDIMNLGYNEDFKHSQNCNTIFSTSTFLKINSIRLTKHIKYLSTRVWNSAYVRNRLYKFIFHNTLRWPCFSYVTMCVNHDFKNLVVVVYLWIQTSKGLFTLGGSWHYCKGKIADTHLYKYCSTQLKQSPQRENTRWRPIHIEVNWTSKWFNEEIIKKVCSAGGQTNTCKHHKRRSFLPPFGVNTFIAFSQCKPTV